MNTRVTGGDGLEQGAADLEGRGEAVGLAGLRLDPGEEIEALTTLAMLDVDAAAAYQAASAASDDEAIRAALDGFRADHLRHVAELDRLIQRRGGAPVSAAGAPPLLPRLASLAGRVGPDAALLALLANEELTNASYDIAMALAVDPETRAVLERNYGDEQRHLEWIQDTVQQLFDDDAVEAEPAEAVVPSTD
jgi:rubrerythrin